MKNYTFTVPAKEITFESPDDPIVLVEVIKQLNAGRRLWAIKALKNGTDMGLRESKEYIDSFNTQNGIHFLAMLKEENPEYWL